MEPDDHERLGKAIALFLTAVDRFPDNQPAKHVCLSFIGTLSASLFQLFGSLKSLDIAIKATSSAVEITPDGHPDMLKILSKLGSFFGLRFECLGELEDL
ncbi:hypothetical protein K488DRAFT_66044, partial [Vararia minispora EC-137]